MMNTDKFLSLCNIAVKEFDRVAHKEMVKGMNDGTLTEIEQIKFHISMLGCLNLNEGTAGRELAEKHYKAVLDIVDSISEEVTGEAYKPLEGKEEMEFLCECAIRMKMFDKKKYEALKGRVDRNLVNDNLMIEYHFESLGCAYLEKGSKERVEAEKHYIEGNRLIAKLRQEEAEKGTRIAKLAEDKKQAHRDKISKIKADKDKKVCPRCQGFGTIDAYRHHDNGFCFKCKGAGWVAKN